MNRMSDRERRYRSGDTVYGSGRSSPHLRTKLDPTGYIERELTKRRIAQRSRLAQAALGRIQTANKNTGGTGTPTVSSNSYSQQGLNTGGSGTPTGGTTNSYGNQNTSGTGTDTGTGTGTGTGNGAPLATLNGKLVPMPWDMQMDWLNASQQLAQQFAGWDSQINQANVDLGKTLRDMALQRVVDNRSLANREAGRGMSFSSDNAYNISDMANRYANAESDARNYVANLQGEYGVGGTQRALAQGQFDQYAAMLQAEAARILAEKAGTLGLGSGGTTTGSVTGVKNSGNKKSNVRKITNKNRGTKTPAQQHMGVTIADKNRKPAKQTGSWVKRKRKGS